MSGGLKGVARGTISSGRIQDADRIPLSSATSARGSKPSAFADMRQKSIKE